MTKRRKSLAAPPPNIRLLLRDATPTWWEIEGARDVETRRNNEQRRDDAINELLIIYLDHKRHERLGELDPEARCFCEYLIKQPGSKEAIRRRKDPYTQNRRIMICINAQDEVARRPKENVGDILRSLAANEGISEFSVRNIYYDRDPQWIEEVRLSRLTARRPLPTDPNES